MKLILLIAVFASIPFLSFSQTKDIAYKESDFPVDASTRRISFMLIDTIPTLSADEIFSKSLEWIAINFRDANNVIKVQDRIGGKIIVKGFSKQSYNYRYLTEDLKIPYNLWFMINITVRDGRYRIVLTDFYTESGVRASPNDFVSAEETPLELTRNSLPQSYDFEKLKRREKSQLLVSKQVMLNTKTQAQKDINSMRAFIRKNAGNVIKADDRF